MRAVKKVRGQSKDLRIKIWLISIPSLIAVMLLCGFLYTAIMDSEWAATRQDVQTAYEKSLLAKAIRAERFAGEKGYTVIHGEDKLGHPVIVWISKDGEVITDSPSSGISEEEAEAKLIAEQPAAKVLRVQLGILNGDKVWEVFYKVRSQDNGEMKHYYVYYTFADGNKLDTWNLSIH